jgi:integrase
VSTKRSGQIIPKGPKKYLVRVYLGRDAAGKRKYLSQLVHGGKKAADAALTDMLGDKSKGTLRPRTKRTVDAWLDEWLETIAKPSVRPQTAATYAEVLKLHVRPYLGGLRLSQLAEGDVLRMIGALRDRGLSPRTVRMAREVLRNALAAAVDARPPLLAVNPAVGKNISKGLPKTSDTERPTLPADRVADFLEVCRGDPTAAYWVLLLFSGLRPSEALALRWGDVRGDSVSVARVLVWRPGTEPRFDAPKTDKSRRRVQVPTIVVKALGEHKRRQAAARLAAGVDWKDQGLVFCDEHGGPLQQQRMREVFKKILAAAELPTMRVYDLRHSCATLLLERGLALKVISERLGHSTTALTADTYSHVTVGMQQQAVDVLEELGQ